MYTEECINIFLENQGQLFPQPVAASYEEAETFLEDCMAAVVDSLGEVREYLEDMGADVDGMSVKNWKKPVKYLPCRMEST